MGDMYNPYPPESPFKPYYECHITTEPLYDKSYEQKALEMATGFGFRFAKLYKRVDVAGAHGWEENRVDSFCTGRGFTYADKIGSTV